MFLGTKFIIVRMVRSWVFKLLMMMSRLSNGVERIKACRESGLPVRKWCKQNNICEQTYYCWLKKLRKMTIETVPVQAPSFVPVDQSTLDKQNIIITKRDVRIEFPCDTDIGTVTNIIGALLC